MGSSYTATTGPVTIHIHVKHRLYPSLAQQSPAADASTGPSVFRDVPVNLSSGISFYRSIKQQVIICAQNSGVYESNSFVFSEPFVLCLWNGAQYITIQDSQPVLNGPDVFWITQSHALLDGKQYCSQLEQVSIAVGHNRVLKAFVNLEVPASILSQQQWSSKFVMEKAPESFPERFDYLNAGKQAGDPWSAARTVFKGLALREAGTPDEAAEQELREMPFTNCRWLCPEALMDPAVREQFVASPAQLVTPPSEITMMSSFDYLERAFVDLFGAWSPQEQAFKRAFPHDEVEGLYQQSAWLPRMLNRALDTMPFFSEDFNDVCPWNGTAVFWMSADNPVHKSFITLVRHAHTLPYAPLPCAIKDLPSLKDDNYAATMFAVFQPIDDIQPSVLNDLEQAHRDRHAWQQKKRGLFRKLKQENQHGAELKPSGSLKRTRAEAQNDSKDGNGEIATTSARGSAQLPSSCPKEEAVVIDTQPMCGDATSLLPEDEAEYGRAACNWASLVPQPKAPEGQGLTGFLVHVVPIGRLMEWQYSFLRPGLPPEARRAPYAFRYPPLPPLRDMTLPHEQVCAVIACDIDHTLINQALQVTIPNTQYSKDQKLKAAVAGDLRSTAESANSSKIALDWLKQRSSNMVINNLKETWTSRSHRADLNSIAFNHIDRCLSTIILVEDGNIRPQRQVQSGAHNGMFQPGMFELSDPKHPAKVWSPAMSMSLIYPRRSLCELIAACYPVRDGAVVMRFKPVFTTAGSQPYADTVITALKVLVMKWLNTRLNSSTGRALTRALHANTGLAQQQVQLFFRGPVISMMAARHLGPQVKRDRIPTEAEPNMSGPKEATVTKNFARFLLFGMLQHGALLHNLSAMLTKRAAISVDDSPSAWGEEEFGSLLHLYPAKTPDCWDNTQHAPHITFENYMHALAHHGAEVEDLPQRDLATGKYHLVRTPRAELSIVAERLEMLYEFAMVQYPLLAPTTYTCLYNDHMHRSPAPLDQLLPVTRVMYDNHVAAMEEGQKKLDLANYEIAQLEARVSELMQQQGVNA